MPEVSTQDSVIKFCLGLIGYNIKTQVCCTGWYGFSPSLGLFLWILSSRAVIVYIE